MSNNSKIKMIFLDIDGTLLDRRAGVPLHREVTDAIADAALCGIPSALCTARSLGLMRTVMKETGTEDYAVFCNGAGTFARGDVRTVGSVGEAELTALLRGCSAADIALSFVEAEHFYVRYCAAYDEPDLAPTEKDAPEFADADESGDRTRSPLVRETKIAGLGYSVVEDKWMQLLAAQSEPTVLAAYMRADDRIGIDKIKAVAASSLAGREDRVNMEQSAPDDLIITAAGIDKAAGMLSLAASLGIKREEILAIGNDGNDLSMIREAGVGVAMGGSPDYIKTAADYVTDTVENRGAALAIRKFTQPCHSRA